MGDADDIDWAIEPGKGIGPLHLGATRSEVIQRITAAGLTTEDDPDEPQWLMIDEIDIELKFSENSPSVLIEIASSDERLRLGPLEFIDEPVIKIVDLLKISNEETVWTLPPEDADAMPASATSVDESGHSRPSGPSIEKLLKDGTLWVRPFGLGLELVLGDIFNVRLRMPGDIPPVECGPLTAAHRAYSSEPDVISKLLDSPSLITRRKSSLFSRLLGAATFILLGLIVWEAIKYQQRWNEAPDVQAEVIAATPPPPEPFPDYYTVAYSDLEGNRHEVMLDKWEVYGLPDIGAKLDVRYLPEEPDKPMTPARYQDAAVSKYLPWGIGVIAGYLVLQAAGLIAGWVLQRSAAMLEPK